MISRVRIGDFLDSAMAALGPFDVIIGNPPYIRQEQLGRDATFQWDERLQTLRESYADYREAYPEQGILWSRKLDLYLAFFLQAGFLLKPGGRLAFVTSNSWLSSMIGEPFRRFLHHFFHVRLLAESACERWFSGAAVNAVIVLLEKRPAFLLPNHRADRPATLLENHPAEACPGPVRTLRFLRPLREWTPDPASPDYWRTLAAWADAIRAGDVTGTTLAAQGGFSGERSRPFALGTLSTASLDTGPLSRNWALALHAPRPLWEWLECDALRHRLDAWGTVRYPLKTGINRFFYLSHEQAKAWGIEPEFLRPVVRSARRVTRWLVGTGGIGGDGMATFSEAPPDKPRDGQTDWLFVCRESTESLARAGKTGALRYIRWGESQTAPPRQKRQQAVPWPQVASVRARRPWYAIRPLPPAHILCNRFLDRRFFFAVCQGDIIEDQTFYGLTLHDGHPSNVAFAAALLNSTLSFALLEFNARGSLGDGVLQYARGDMAALPTLHPALYGTDERTALAEAFRQMATRPIRPLEAELYEPDRQALDELALRPLVARLPGRPSVDAYREELITHLLSRLSERRQLARSKPPVPGV